MNGWYSDARMIGELGGERRGDAPGIRAGWRLRGERCACRLRRDGVADSGV